MARHTGEYETYPGKFFTKTGHPVGTPLTVWGSIATTYSSKSGASLLLCVIARYTKVVLSTSSS
jgi:hypothetical protein